MTLWRDRRERLDHSDVRQALGLEEDTELGALLDRAASVLARGKLNGLPRLPFDGVSCLRARTEADHALLADFVELALHPERDFQHYCSLDVSQHSKVDIVQCPAEGSGRVYVRKAITKDFATRMRGQCTPFNERDLLVAALDEERRSPHIPELLAALHNDDFLFLFIEYLPGGTLLDALEGQPDHIFAEETVQFWIAEAVEAIRWVHSCGLAHRDIKPNNFLMDRAGHLKLTDFGSSAHFSVEKPSGPYKIEAGYCLTPVGTVDYLAPEILLAHQAALDADDSNAEHSVVEGSDTYGPEIDWWSLGVTMFELLYGTTPFYASSIAETYELIVRFEEFLRFPEQPRTSSAAIDLIQSMLSPAEERLGYTFGAEELEQHHFFDAIDFENLHQAASPFVPEQSSLPPPSRQQSLEPDNGMPSLFASPGLSFLRSTTPEASPQAWEGFTYLPARDAFEHATFQGEVPHVDEASHAFLTPARPSFRSMTGSACRSRDRRALGDNMQALRELADYGALKSAQKRRSASRGIEVDVDDQIAGHVTPPPSTRPGRVSDSRQNSADASETVNGARISPLPSFVLAPRNLSSDPQTRSRQTSLEDTQAMPRPPSRSAEVRQEPAPPDHSLQDIHRVWTRQTQLSSKLGQLETRFEQLSVSASRR